MLNAFSTFDLYALFGVMHVQLFSRAHVRKDSQPFAVMSHAILPMCLYSDMHWLPRLWRIGNPHHF